MCGCSRDRCEALMSHDPISVPLERAFFLDMITPSVLKALVIHDQTSTKPHLAGFIKWLSPLGWVLAMCGQVFWHFQMKYGLKWKTHQGVRWSGLGKNIVLCEFSGYNQEGEGILVSLEKYGQILSSEKHYETVVSSPWRNCWQLYHIYLVCMCTRSLSCVRLFETPWTVAHQVLLSMGFPRQESWSGLPFPPPGDLPNQGIWIWVSYIGR